MLAKEMKIKNLRLQREVIREELKNSFFEGEASYTYLGEVFPENVKYFQEVEGFEVTKLDSEEIRREYEGRPLYVFSAANVELNEEEMEEAESRAVIRELAPDTIQVLKELEEMGVEVNWEDLS